MSEQVTSVTFDDVVNVMSEFGITLTLADDEPIGSANLNGYNVTFALVNNTAVRKKLPTATPPSAWPAIISMHMCTAPRRPPSTAQKW